MPTKLVPVEPLTPTTFADFGTVISTPPTSSLGVHLEGHPANQGTATKYDNIFSLSHFYHLAPSRKPAAPSTSLFRCKPREVRSESAVRGCSSSSGGGGSDDGRGAGVIDVTILERHPFTPQTFIPLGHAGADPSASYIVVVAPTLPVSRGDRAALLSSPKPYPTPDAPRKRWKRYHVFARGRPAPFTNDQDPPLRAKDERGTARSGRLPKGAGKPDLTRLRAFVARGDQAVTYAAGTWHAPMTVVGGEMWFVVVQWGNGVAAEDCQEVELEEGVRVVVRERFEGVGRGNGRVEVPVGELERAKL